MHSNTSIFNYDCFISCPWQPPLPPFAWHVSLSFQRDEHRSELCATVHIEILPSQKLQSCVLRRRKEQQGKRGVEACYLGRWMHQVSKVSSYSNENGEYINSHLLLAFLSSRLTREYNQFRLIFLQSVNIQLQTFLRSISSSMINGNPQFQSLLNFKSSLLEFFERKSSSLADFNVVAETGTTDCGTEEGCWTGGKGCCTFCTSETTTLFTCWLIEPGSDPSLPILNKSMSGLSQDIIKASKCTFRKWLLGSI